MQNNNIVTSHITPNNIHTTNYNLPSHSKFVYAQPLHPHSQLQNEIQPSYPMQETNAQNPSNMRETFGNNKNINNNNSPLS